MGDARLIRVIIADDHDIVRQGISMLLSDVEDISVVGEGSTGEEAYTLVKKTDPDVVLLDIRMPGMGGLEAAKKIIARKASIGVIALSGYSDGPYPGLFVKAGALGYLKKGADKTELVRAIRQVYQGEAYLTPDVAHAVVATKSSTSDNPFDQLSDRELQIALMVLSSPKIDDIAEQLALSPKTISSYKHRLYEKLNIQSDVELTLLALSHDMIDTGSAGRS